MTSPEKNDCVWCAHEQGNYCTHFQEPINPNMGTYRPSGWKGRAARNQGSCSGFQLDPHMANRWRNEYGAEPRLRQDSPQPLPSQRLSAALDWDETEAELDGPSSDATTDKTAERTPEQLEAERYALQYGPFHLIQMGRERDAAEVLASFEYHYARVDGLGKDGLDDVADAFKQLHESGMDTDDVATWRTFLEKNAHLFERGGASMLLQAALGEPESSAVARSATRQRSGVVPPKGTWLRRLNRPRSASAEPRVRTLESHTDDVSCVRPHRDGKRLISSSFDGTLKIWDLHSGRCLTTLTAGRQQHFALALTPDGTRAITTSGLDLKVWDLVSGKHISSIPRNARMTVRSIACGNRLAALGAHGDFSVWDLVTGSRLHTFDHPRYLSCLAIHPREDRVAAASDGKAVVHRLDTGEVTSALILPDAGSFRWIRFVGDDCFAIVEVREATREQGDPRDGETLLVLWDLASRKRRGSLRGHRGKVVSFEIQEGTPGGPRIITADFNGTIRTWNLNDLSCIDTLQTGSLVPRAVTLSVDAKLAISANADGAIRMWALSSSEETMGNAHQGAVTSIRIHPRGLLAFSSDATELKVWNVIDGTCAHTVPGLRPSVVHWDSNLAAYGDDDGIIRLWDTRECKKVRALYGHEDGAYGYGSGAHPCAFSYDGKILLTLGSDRTFRLWDVQTGKLLRTITYTVDYDYRAETATLHPDGRVLLGKYRKGIELWDPQLGRCTRKYHPASETVDKIVVLPGGLQIISGGRRGGLSLTNLETGESRSAVGDAGATYRWMATVQPTGRILVCTASDKTAQVWDLQRRKMLARFDSDAPVVSCAIGETNFVGIGDATGSLAFLALEEPPAG